MPSGLYSDILLNSGAENRPHHSSLLEDSSTLYVTYTVLSFKSHLLKKRDTLESYENLKTGFPFDGGIDIFVPTGVLGGDGWQDLSEILSL